MQRIYQGAEDPIQCFKAAYDFAQHRLEQRQWVEDRMHLRFVAELYRKQMQGSEKDGRPSVVDEKKQLERAVRSLESAQRRLEATRKWRNRLEREYALFKGQTSGLGTIAERQVPAAVARLDRMLIELEAYVSERSGTQADLGELLAHESPDSVARRGTDRDEDGDQDGNQDGDGPDRDPTADGGGS